MVTNQVSKKEIESMKNEYLFRELGGNVKEIENRKRTY